MLFLTVVEIPKFEVLILRNSRNSLKIKVTQNVKIPTNFSKFNNHKKIPGLFRQLLRSDPISGPGNFTNTYL